MPFDQNQLPTWNKEGVEPPQSLKDEGWQPSQKPPADYFNWFFNKTFKALQSLFSSAQHKEEKGQPNGYAALNADGKVVNADGSLPGGVTSVNNKTGAVTLSAADVGAVSTDDYVNHPAFAVASGTANTYSVTLNPAPTGYTDGMAISVKINVDSTGPSTLNVNGLGAIPLKKANGNDVTNLKANGVYTFRYNASTGNFILQGEGGSGNAQPSDVLSGKTFTNDSGEQTGTMPNNGAQIITPTTINQAIPQGYHNGLGYVEGSPNLLADNIKEGVNIFGVVGNLTKGFSLDNLKLNNVSIPDASLYYYNGKSIISDQKTFYDTSLSLSFMFLQGNISVLASNDQNGEFCYANLNLKTKADNKQYLLNRAYASGNSSSQSKNIGYFLIVTMGQKSMIVSTNCDFNSSGFKIIDKVDLSKGFSLYGDVYIYSDTSPINTVKVEFTGVKIYGS